MTNTPAITEKKKTVTDIAAERVRALAARNELHLPADYSAENALKAAWLVLQDVVDKDKNPALKVCDQNSVAMALFNMVVLGLNPLKKQCYFMVYGKSLACQPSYFGNMAMAKRLDERIDEFVYEVVYEGDRLTYKIDRGKRIVENHEQELANVSNGKIVAAYCMALDRDGKVLRAELMTWEEIKQSWRQSKQRVFDDKGNLTAGSVHSKFTRDMALRTVINKVAKPLINNSDDAYLKLAIEATRGGQVEQELEHALATEANQGEIIDILPDSHEEQQCEEPSSLEKLMDSQHVSSGAGPSF